MLSLKKEKMIDELKKEIDYYECAAKAWDSVKFPTKKNGSEFKNFERNFVGANVISDPMSGRKIVVHFQTELQGYQSATEWLVIHENAGEFTFLGKKLDESRIVKRPMLAPIIELNVEEVKQAVRNRAKTCKNLAEKRRKQLEGIDEKMDKFEKTINQSLIDCGLADLSWLINKHNIY